MIFKCCEQKQPLLWLVHLRHTPFGRVSRGCRQSSRDFKVLPASDVNRQQFTDIVHKSITEMYLKNTVCNMDILLQGSPVQ